MLDVEGLEDVTDPAGVGVIVHEADVPEQTCQRLDDWVQEEDEGLPRQDGRAVQRPGSAFDLRRAVGPYVALADPPNSRATGDVRDVRGGDVEGGGDGRVAKDGAAQRQGGVGGRR